MEFLSCDWSLVISERQKCQKLYSELSNIVFHLKKSVSNIFELRDLHQGCNRLCFVDMPQTEKLLILAAEIESLIDALQNQIAAGLLFKLRPTQAASVNKVDEAHKYFDLIVLVYKTYQRRSLCSQKRVVMRRFYQS